MNKQNKHSIKIASTKSGKFDFQSALKKIVHNFMAAERELTPLILHKQLPVNEALVLIAVRADGMNTGNPKEHLMTLEDINSATMVLVELWRKGLFVPSSQFPFTFEHVLEVMF